MSFSTGVILLANDWTGRPAELLERLGLPDAFPVGQVTLAAATRRDFVGTAVGAFAGHTLIIDPYLPYGCSHQPDKWTPLDARLAALSATGGPILAAVFEGVSSSYAFSYFEDSQRVRCRTSDSGRVLAESGEPLAAERAAEAEFSDGEIDDATRLLALSAGILGRPLDDVIFDEPVVLHRYSR